VDEIFQKIKDITIAEETIVSDEEAAKIAKRSITSLIGIWGISKRHKWRCMFTDWDDDCPTRVHLRRFLNPDEVKEHACHYDLASKVTTVTNHTYRPWQQITLDMEIARVFQAKAAIDSIGPEVAFAGGHLDCCNFIITNAQSPDPEKKTKGSVKKRSKGVLTRIKEVFSQFKYPDGSPVYKLVLDPIRYGESKSTFMKPSNLETNLAPEGMVEEVADINSSTDLIKKRGGALVTGPPGSGNT